VSTVEENIKGFLRERGISLMGIAGPERWKNGPPSIDPTYMLPGAKSIIAWAVPFNVPAIYDFLSKKSPGPHNLDQLKQAQKMNRVAKELVEFLKSMGYHAAQVMTNNTYRRSPDIFATRPSLSHRFAAVITGLGTFGLSGNVVTREYGAAILLDTVVTNAVLESDPVQPARYTMDNRCRACKLCDKSCTLGTFLDDEEEYVLLNGELHPRGKRANIDFCATACFGLHGISRDKKWSTWGKHWISKWVENPPDPQDRAGVRAAQTHMGAIAGDSTARYQAIRRSQAILWPKDRVEDIIPDYEDLPKSEEELFKLVTLIQEHTGIHGLKEPWVQTCGNCGIVCGPDFDETKKRFDMLTKSGIVVPGQDGNYVHTDSFEEAAEIKRKYPHRIERAQIARDAATSGSFWVSYYFGFEPKSELQNVIYQQKAKRAAAKAGLKGKEAKDPAVYDLKWVLASMFDQDKKKKRRDATKDTAEFTA
jgi:Fe-S-cluster-containing hydrogenase component 2